MIIGVFIKFLPDSWFNVFQMNENPMTEEQIKDAFTTSLRKSFRSSHRKSKEVKVTKE